jgi:hypothetical protein
VLELLPWGANSSPEAFLNPLDFHQDFNFCFVIAKKLEIFSKISAKISQTFTWKNKNFQNFPNIFQLFGPKKQQNLLEKKSLVSLLLLVCHMQ